MIKNSKLIKLLRIIALGLISIVILTIIISKLKPQLEFPDVRFNRLWGFLMCYFSIISFVIFLLIYNSFKKLTKRIILGFGILIVIIAILNILVMHAQIEYEPHFDRYVIYKNANKSNQYIVVQDFTKWKPNLPSVDTVLINDYIIIRECKHFDSLTIKGTWIKFDEDKNIIDKITIK